MSARYLEQAGKSKELIETLSNASVVIGRLGDSTKALETAQRTVDLSISQGDKLLEAISRRRLALAYLSQSRYDEALPVAEVALEMFREAGDFIGEIHALNLVAIIKSRHGRLEEAEADYLRALKITETIGHDTGINFLVKNLSRFYFWRLGESAKPLALIQEFKSRATLVGNESLVKLLQEDEIYVLYHSGQYVQAVDLAETILPGYEKLRDKAKKGELLGLLGVLSAELGKFKQAHKYLEQAVESCASIKGEISEVVVPINIAQVALVEREESILQGVLESVTQGVIYARGHNLIERLGWALWMEARIHLVMIGKDLSHAAAAIKCTKEAMKLTQIEYPDMVMPELCLYLHGCALRVNGKEQEADDYLRKAYERVMMVAGNFTNEDYRRSYLENVRDNREILATYQERFG
jgi:tetratricopeptide (TPR) repeat protein